MSENIQVRRCCQDSDSAALEALIRNFRLQVRRFALSILRDPVEADEATQDSFIAAIDELDTYRRESSFKTCFLPSHSTPVEDGYANVVREKLQQALLGLFGRASQTSVHPEQIMLRNETQATVWRAINELDDQLREILVLRHYCVKPRQ
jgi:RNA polymerase sigma-70 factor, ECF subfamily